MSPLPSVFYTFELTANSLIFSGSVCTLTAKVKRTCSLSLLLVKNLLNRLCFPFFFLSRKFLAPLFAPLTVAEKKTEKWRQKKGVKCFILFYFFWVIFHRTDHCFLRHLTSHGRGKDGGRTFAVWYISNFF